MARAQPRKRRRTVDQTLARIDAILVRLEELERRVRAQLGRMEGTTLH
jgi:hypothetical protein